MTNKTQILLVEDNPQYANAAKDYLTSRNYEVAHARDYFEAVEQLKEPSKFKGVITDLFFPDRTGSNSITLGIKLVDRVIGTTPIQTIKGDGIFSPDYTTIDYNTLLIDAMEKSEANQPLGILVAEIAEAQELPFIIATSTYHHDDLTQPFCEYQRNKNWRMVDVDPDMKHKGKADQTFWKRAVSKLEELLASN